MKLNIYFTPTFSKKFKRYLKKFQSLKADLDSFLSGIDKSSAADLGGGVYKYRMSVKSKNKGKSGGFRVITFELILSEEEKDITLLTIYDKSEQASITQNQVEDILKEEGLI